MRFETIRGRGLLIGAGVNTKVSYEIYVDQEMIPAGSTSNPSAKKPGLKSMTATLTFANSTQAPSVGREMLTLQLEDGRKVNGFYSGIRRFVISGDFF